MTAPIGATPSGAGTSLLAVAFGGLLVMATPRRGRTTTRPRPLADDVFGCMASNDETQEALHRCSCSIDVIASILPYDDYVKAETVLRIRRMQGGGGKAELFPDTAVAKAAVDKLKRAQTEAEVRCF
jgi:hypothetical protein